MTNPKKQDDKMKEKYSILFELFIYESANFLQRNKLRRMNYEALAKFQM
jgi:hypothetical protein